MILFIQKKMIYKYIDSIVSSRVNSYINILDVFESFCFSVFGKESKESITKKINLVAVEYLMSYTSRLVCFGISFLIYLCIFEQLFIFLIDVDFKSWYEPIIWPYTILFTDLVLAIITIIIFCLLILILRIIRQRQNNSKYS